MTKNASHSVNHEQCITFSESIAVHKIITSFSTSMSVHHSVNHLQYITFSASPSAHHLFSAFIISYSSSVSSSVTSVTSTLSALRKWSVWWVGSDPVTIYRAVQLIQICLVSWRGDEQRCSKRFLRTLIVFIHRFRYNGHSDNSYFQLPTIKPVQCCQWTVKVKFAVAFLSSACPMIINWVWIWSKCCHF